VLLKDKDKDKEARRMSQTRLSDREGRWIIDKRSECNYPEMQMEDVNGVEEMVLMLLDSCIIWFG
jgi:hypothetical protein